MEGTPLKGEWIIRATEEAIQVNQISALVGSSNLECTIANGTITLVLRSHDDNTVLLVGDLGDASIDGIWKHQTAVGWLQGGSFQARIQ